MAVTTSDLGVYLVRRRRYGTQIAGSVIGGLRMAEFAPKTQRPAGLPAHA